MLFYDYVFPVSLSTDAYVDKIISNAMISSSKNESTKEIRKRYNYKPNIGVGFKRENITVVGLLNAMLEGKVFCHLFTPTKYRKDGSFGSYMKKNEFFDGSYVIGVDIDHTGYDSVESYIEALDFKPTFYYTTYSNMQENKGPRFRMIYVFSEIIKTPYYFRYCAYLLNKIIERQTGEDIDDNCNLQCSQYFNGTCIDNKDIHLSYKLFGNVYSLSDLGVTIDGYKEFLCSYAHYKSIDNKRTDNIKNVLEHEFGISGMEYNFLYSERRFVHIPKHIYTEPVNIANNMDLCKKQEYLITKKEYDGEPLYSVDAKFNEPVDINLILYDFDTLPIEQFNNMSEWKKAKVTVPYIWRVEKEWIDDAYQMVDDDYFSLFYHLDVLGDGNHRRKIIFQRMCLRRIIKPDATRIEIIVNALMDIIRFCDNSDKTFNKDFINKNVDAAFASSVDDLKIRYAGTIKFLKDNTRPKKGIIYKHRDAHTIETTYGIIDNYYDCNKSVAENLHYIKNVANFNIGQTTLYKYMKSRNINSNNMMKLSDKELMKLLDVKLSVRKNLEILRDSNIKCNNNQIAKLLNIKKEKLSKRKN